MSRRTGSMKNMSRRTGFSSGHVLRSPDTAKVSKMIYDSSEGRSGETAKVKSKMMYASSKDRFKRESDIIQVEPQGTDLN
ncbi:hypothetical protein BUALT_BualtUnG0049700 [Buddleja alternifolia]|uniref:ADF-H domain-containing protein n=1 Tax=Buddleja alternifolia TaxID=168488 RepID=A0AAV6W3A0_9LAMI|nr:hypothetical protein BUALT_BualtUnG0049700 [Buddleja alternifolia]